MFSYLFKLLSLLRNNFFWLGYLLISSSGYNPEKIAFREYGVAVGINDIWYVSSMLNKDSKYGITDKN